MHSGKFAYLLAAFLATSAFSLAYPILAHAGRQMQRQANSTKAFQSTIRLAQGASEKEAYEAAKDLGTIEAWKAFLNNFPKGFRADLARAYLKQISSVSSASSAPAQAVPPTPVAPLPQPVAQPPAPPPLTAPVLQPIHLGPDAAPWRNGNYSMDEGNASAYSASVQSSGLELTAYCSVNQQLNVVLGESNRGVYPDFDQRIAQGLTASRGQYGTPEQRISIHFTNNSEHILPAHEMGLTGEVAISSEIPGGGFLPGGRFVNDMMSAQSMTFSLPPFGATFQLTNSRLALCNVLTSCGVSTPGCARFALVPVSTYTPPPQKKKYKKKTYTKKKSGCPGGTVWLESQCVKYSDVTSFCGPGYKRSGSKCVSRYPATTANIPAQQPQQQQNAPTAVQILQGIAGALQQQQNNQPRKCPPGKVWEVASCVEND